MTLGVLLSKKNLVAGSLWQLQVDTNGFESQDSEVLSTQVRAGRCFQVLKNLIDYAGKASLNQRIQVRLLEDGYVCWFDLNKLLGQAFRRNAWKPNFLNQSQIRDRIPKILFWIKEVSKNNNQYLWGGTLGPDFDCSGLVQTAFSNEEIWLPRDAYQQELFCQRLEASPADFSELMPGDLLFFGSKKQCTHVGLHIENGFYWHSSGLVKGRNGIGIDGIQSFEKGVISCYYKAQFRSAGRVVCCYDVRRLLG